MTGKASSSCAVTSPARRQANERLSVNRAGHVVLKLKTAWPEWYGHCHHVMTPMEFMQRLAAPGTALDQRSCKCTDGAENRYVGPEYCQRC